MDPGQATPQHTAHSPTARETKSEAHSGRKRFLGPRRTHPQAHAPRRRRRRPAGLPLRSARPGNAKPNSPLAPSTGSPTHGRNNPQMTVSPRLAAKQPAPGRPGLGRIHPTTLPGRGRRREDKAGRKLLWGGGEMARKPICPTRPPPWSPCREGGLGQGCPTCCARGGGGGSTLTYMAQNDPHIALIILTTHMWRKIF